MSTKVFAAVDLGASSGRVMLGRTGSSTLELTEAHRFDNEPVRLPGGLHWDIHTLHCGILTGLRAIGAQADPVSIGVDSWAVDYGLLDADGALLGNPYHYRDGRTDGVAARVHARVPAQELYQITGVAHLPFNTIFQLAAAQGSPQLAAAHTLLMIPDLMGYWLTGTVGAELTNASTTGLIDLCTMDWSTQLIGALGLPAEIFPQIHHPGEKTDPLLPGVATQVGLPQTTPVVSVGSHDTASAVVAVPAQQPHFAYISSGTWSLVGLELDRPVLSEAGRAANFTNEVGVDGTIRYLRNVTGLWLLQECLRTWRDAGLVIALPDLLAAVAAQPRLVSVIDPNDPQFLPPGDMPARIAAHCRDHGEPVPHGPVAVTRCILDSLALAYCTTVRDAARLAGREVDVVHIVGGGVRNTLLCQLTADACGMPVLAGPVEATALGNVLVQARSAGVVPDLAAARRLVASTQQVRRYDPTGDRRAWDVAAARLGTR